MEKNSEPISVINVDGIGHVIRPSSRGVSTGKDGKNIPDANYRGTGQALCGILLKGESLNQWKERTGNK